MTHKLLRELSEIRTRSRKLQGKILKVVDSPKYYSALHAVIDELINADNSLAQGEYRLKKYLDENEVEK